MSDVSVEDGSVTSDGSSGDGGEGISVNQTVNTLQNQDQQQQQQQDQGFQPVFVSPFAGQGQFQGSPHVLIPLSTHVQAQGLLAQLQGLLGL
jgi:hypothetical protein